MEAECINLYSFLRLVRGNWRNAVFIECNFCPCDKSDCGNHLLTTDSDGRPKLIPVNLFERLTGECVVQDECAVVIQRDAFENLYHHWLLWNTESAKECSILQLLPKAKNHTL